VEVKKEDEKVVVNGLPGLLTDEDLEEMMKEWEERHERETLRK
jgi:hypothetical protein